LGIWGLYYQFSDKTLFHGSGVGGLKDKYAHFIEGMHSGNLVGALRELVPATWGIGEAGHRILNLLATCCHRSTSKPLDQVTCLASVLHLDVDRVLSIQNWELEHKRMGMFYTLLGDPSPANATMDGIPTNLLFMDGPRLSFSGFSWALSHFFRGSHQAS